MAAGAAQALFHAALKERVSQKRVQPYLDQCIVGSYTKIKRIKNEFAHDLGQSGVEPHPRGLAS